MKAKVLSSLCCVALGGFLVSGKSDAKESVAVTVKPEREYFLDQDNVEVIVKFGLEGVKVRSGKRLPINLSVVLDRSGSMAGAKLEKAKQAACVVLDQLSEKDSFSLIIYDNEASVLIEPQLVGKVGHLKKKIHQLESGGSTALYDGVCKGADQLEAYFSKEKVNRVILLSDGMANVGPSSARELSHLGSKLRRQNLTVTTVGLGDDYNENLMVALAEASAANYYYVKDAEKLPGIFAEELGNMHSIVARNIRVILELSEGVVPVEIVGHPEVVFKEGGAEIEVGELYGKEKRDFILKCKVPRVKSKEMEVAKVRAVYRDELNNGNVEKDAVSRVKFTSDRKASVASVDKDVAVGYARKQNLAAREEVLKLVDTGKKDEAVALLNMQIQSNKVNISQYGDAVLEDENVSMERNVQELKEEGGFSKGSRKSFQWGNYNQKRGRYQKGK